MSVTTQTTTHGYDRLTAVLKAVCFRAEGLRMRAARARVPPADESARVSSQGSRREIRQRGCNVKKLIKEGSHINTIDKASRRDQDNRGRHRSAVISNNQSTFMGRCSNMWQHVWYLHQKVHARAKQTPNYVKLSHAIPSFEMRGPRITPSSRTGACFANICDDNMMCISH